MPLNNNGWTNRGWLEIISKILELSQNGARKTHLMYKCNLNSVQINQYLDFLVENKMLLEHKERPHTTRIIYFTSENGKKCVRYHKSLIGLFERQPATIMSQS